MAQSSHFTAVVEVSETTHTETTTGRYNEPKVESREVKEITRLVIRADTLASLLAKVAAHVALIED